MKEVVFKPDPSKPNQVLVFGSNLRGAHGKGAALDAKINWGARNGVGSGMTGRSYAIPTKDRHLNVIELGVIQLYVSVFIYFAKSRPDLEFLVTRIGCGLAGYRDEQISPMFKDAPENCVLPDGWRPLQPTTHLLV